MLSIRGALTCSFARIDYKTKRNGFGKFWYENYEIFRYIQVSLKPAAQCRAEFEPCDERRLAEQKSPVLTAQTMLCGVGSGSVLDRSAIVHHEASFLSWLSGLSS